MRFAPRQGARNPKLASGSPGHLAAAAGLEMLEVPEVLDRSRGDLHAAGNPHFLMDPLNAQRVARRIAEVLAVLDPPEADRYRANAARFCDQPEAKMVTWQQRLEPHGGRSIVAYHNIWPYFARRFGLHLAAQPPDADIDGAVERFSLAVARVHEQLVAREHAVGVGEEDADEVVIHRRHRHLFAVQRR